MLLRLILCLIACPFIGTLPALAAAPMVAAGDDHAVELRSDGVVWTWGSNIDFQLGDGTPNWRMTPAPVSGLPPVKTVAAGRDFSVALDETGALWTWGANSVGQLGEIPDGELARMAPGKVAAAGLPAFKAAAAGQQHVLAVDADGRLWSFGGDDKSQLGERYPNLGDYAENGLPGMVKGLSGVRAAAAGGLHSLALLEDGRVFAWGSTSDGRLGVGPTPVGLDETPQPQALAGLTGVVAVAAGLAHSAAVLADGTVWTWGLNSNGQLGDGTTESRDAPTKVPGLTGIVAVAAGTAHTLALGADGSVWAWGFNLNGQLGDGSTVERHSPVRAQTPLNVSSLAAGDGHSLAVVGGANPWTWSWGLNASGQLGSGNQTSRSTPGPIALSEASLRAVTALAGFGGSITPSGLTSVIQGGSVAFAITPGPGFAVARIDVTSGGVKRSEPIATTLTLDSVTADTLVEVYFRRLDGYVISVDVDPGGAISPSGVVQVAPGASQAFAVAPDKGWRIRDVLVDGVSIGPVASFSLDNASRDRAVRVMFVRAVPPQAALALLLRSASFVVATSAGPGGGVSPAGRTSVQRGQSLDVAITPSIGYRVKDVLVDGASAGAATSYRFANVTANHSLAATFEAAASAVVIDVGAGRGTISPSGRILVPWGGSQAFVVTPAKGMRVRDVRVNGVSMGPVLTFALDNLTGDNVIQVDFMPVALPFLPLLLGGLG